MELTPEQIQQILDAVNNVSQTVLTAMYKQLHVNAVFNVFSVFLLLGTAYFLFKITKKYYYNDEYRDSFDNFIICLMAGLPAIACVGFAIWNIYMVVSILYNPDYLVVQQILHVVTGGK